MAVLKCCISCGAQVKDLSEHFVTKHGMKKVNRRPRPQKPQDNKLFETDQYLRKP